MTSNSDGQDIINKNTNVAIQFQRELNSLLEIKPPISKEKMGYIVKEAIKEIRHYKHVVYYVESFIKNCSSEHKIPGLYVIDAIIRNSKSQLSNKNLKDIYSNRFSKNMCKTFGNLYSKCLQSDRNKISRVLQLWSKYNILDSELIEKLNRLSSIASIDLAINQTLNTDNENINSNNNDDDDDDDEKDLNRLNYLQQKLAKLQEQKSTKVKIDDKLISEIHKLSSQLLNKTTALSPQITTKNEINKILDFENDLDSDSEKNHYANISSTTANDNKGTTIGGAGSIVFNEDTLNPSERFRKSIDSCAAWLKSTTPTIEQQQQQQQQSNAFKKINLPDLTQPPPPLSLVATSNFKQQQNNSISSVESILQSASKRIKTSESNENDRSRRGLPNIRDKHILICSKTIWLGHLSKTTTQDYVINELSELLSPSSSSKSSSSILNNNNNNNNNIIVDCQLIPPRGCAYVEFIDRKTASKCLDRMKDGYRLDGNIIKIAWATNKGINKDNRMKSFWNVEVGCTFVPWSDLDIIPIENIDFIKWAEGGLIDEDSIPDKYLNIFKKQIDLQLANNINIDKQQQQHMDMELETEDDHQFNNIQQQQQQQFQSQLPYPPQQSFNIQQIPSNLLNSDLLNHLRSTKPQIQFLTPPPPTAQHHLQDIQTAIAHFNQQTTNQQNRNNNIAFQDLHHLAVLQQQQQQQQTNQAFSSGSLVATNPHLASHFQLVQRPLLISQPPPHQQQQQQQQQFRNLNDPIQLLANQQQQIRNISAVLAASNHQQSVTGQHQFFLSNNKIPQMLFLSEAQFQEMNKQQQQQQQPTLGPTLVKSPVVSSTTASFSEIPPASSIIDQTNQSPPPTNSMINPKPLMSFDLLTNPDSNYNNELELSNDNWKKRPYENNRSFSNNYKNNNNKYYQNNRRNYGSNNNNEQKDQDFRYNNNNEKNEKTFLN